jgi:putative membrane protein insertion efficiency factor
MRTKLSSSSKKTGEGGRTAPLRLKVSACRHCHRDFRPSLQYQRVHLVSRTSPLQLFRGVVQAGTRQQEEKEEEKEEVEDPQQVEEKVGVRVALNVLRFYKTAISPLLPPACRFQPTCSVYAMDAYTKYGVGKGTVLTAWRVMRCNPFGGSGYDPVCWPPPGLEWAFKDDSSVNTK